MRTLMRTAAVVLAVAFLAACGDHYGAELHENYEEWEGETSSVYVEVESLGRIGDTIFTLSKGANDTASVACEFTFASATVPNGYIEIIDVGGHNPPSCAVDGSNFDRCIECSATMEANGCTLTCNGRAPSNLYAAAESIDVDLIFTSTFMSDLAKINVGAVRFEAEVADVWTAAELLGNLPTNDFTYCNASAEEFGVNDGAADPNAAFDDGGDGFYESWDYQAYVSAFGADDNKDGFRWCTITTTFDTDISLEGVEVPGAHIDLSGLGIITLTSYICDNAGSCPAPPS